MSDVVDALQWHGRYLWYVGTSNDQLERQGDDDNAYAKLLPIALALGAIAVS